MSKKTCSLQSSSSELGEGFHPIRPRSRPRRRLKRCLHHFVSHTAKEEGIGLVEVLDRMTMQVFVRGYCTMIAAPVKCDVDEIPRGSHYATVPATIRVVLYDLRASSKRSIAGEKPTIHLGPALYLRENVDDVRADQAPGIGWKQRADPTHFPGTCAWEWLGG